MRNLAYLFPYSRKTVFLTGVSLVLAAASACSTEKKILPNPSSDSGGSGGSSGGSGGSSSSGESGGSGGTSSATSSTANASADGGSGGTTSDAGGATSTDSSSGGSMTSGGGSSTTDTSSTDGMGGAAGEPGTSTETETSSETSTTGDPPCLGEESCPGASCAALLDAGATESGIYWIDPEGSTPFEIYCEQETDGGGWALVWKNHGGAIGGELSNADVLSQTGVDVITPHDVDLVSQKHQQAFALWRGSPGVQWVKFSTAWQVSETEGGADTVLAEHAIRMTLPAGVTWDDLFASPTTECLDLGAAVVVHADGERIGSTSFAFRYNANGDSFGFASPHAVVDECGQAATNLISPPDGTLYRVSNTSTNTIRHMLSYRHNSAGMDASRCQYLCWPGDVEETYYDGFTWGVRETP